MPTSQLNQLLNIIKDNPDALENFYQISTNGLDQSVARYKSSQVAIVDLNKFIPIDIFKDRNANLDYIPQGISTFPEKVNSEGLTMLNYSKSYGKVDLPKSH